VKKDVRPERGPLARRLSGRVLAGGQN
jgi:hypothetical protein